MEEIEIPTSFFSLEVICSIYIMLDESKCLEKNALRKDKGTQKGKEVAVLHRIVREGIVKIMFKQISSQLCKYFKKTFGAEEMAGAETYMTERACSPHSKQASGDSSE